MKALIFNSGIGKRMLELTAHCPKSMVHLYNDETIFERQIRLLQESGIDDIVVTTGPYPEMLKSICAKPCYRNIHFEFCHNEIYDSSNYIYSMYKAKNFLNDDVLMMHGDLVFDRDLIPALLKNRKKNLCLINKFKKLPEKDFKGRIINGELVEVGVNIFDSDCFAFQPLYKLSRETVKKWLDSVSDFVECGNINVYAENAFNKISRGLGVKPVSYHNHFIDEVDNKEDLAKVNKEIEQWDYKKQNINISNDYVSAIFSNLRKINSSKPFFVVDSFLEKEIKSKFENVITFSNFTSNPKYEEMIDALKIFKDNACDSIVSVGGGSCIDLAKCIKLSLNADIDCEIPTFKQQYMHNCVRHICVPSTSGTGSESTKHAVLYLNGIKQSICNASILPDFVILSSKLISSVPKYQKISTAMDALCQCIESLWSVKATKISKKYALNGLKLIQNNYKKYLECNPDSLKKMQLAANFSGKAINISETTAAHALSYKITSLYGIPHGHAVAICMNSILSNCNVRTKWNNLDVSDLFASVIKFFDLKMTFNICENLDLLVKSVNADRLKNFPYKLDIKKCYGFIAKQYE